jgi:acyl carrier protein
MNEIIERLKHLISENLDLNIRVEDIDADSALMEEGLKLDSLAIVELITLVEDNFGIQFGEDDLNMEAFGSLRKLAAAISSRTPALV